MYIFYTILSYDEVLIESIFISSYRLSLGDSLQSLSGTFGEIWMSIVILYL